ncbi:MAG: hypothetical protein GX275_12965 [Clostridiales bacterium]|nr:hypothetical protein [Clostridiales bacterium]
MKDNKGLKVDYSSLSYKGKFIRTLWITPFVILTIILLVSMGRNFIKSIIISAILCVVYLAQLIDNYLKWKKEDKSQ